VSVAAQLGARKQGGDDTTDQTVPLALGRKLFAAANEPKTFVRIAGADHNDPQSAEYYEQLERFLADLPAR